MPDNADVIVTTSGKGCFRSDDGGNTFVVSSDGLSRKYMSQLAVDSAKPNVLFTAASAGPPLTWRGPQGANAGLFRSEDQGKHWTMLTGGGLPETILPSPRAVTIDARAGGSVLAGMSDGSVWMTRDYGESFKEIVTGLPSIFGLSVIHD